jgi:hypothetical protein
MHLSDTDFYEAWYQWYAIDSHSKDVVLNFLIEVITTRRIQNVVKSKEQSKLKED